MTLPEMVAALERAIYDLEHSPEQYPRRFEDAAKLLELASLLKGAQEAWQHRNDPEAIHLIEDDDEPSDWSPDYRRVYIIPAEEEK